MDDETEQGMGGLAKAIAAALACIIAVFIFGA